MKKLLALILAATLALSLVACGGDSGAGDNNTPSTSSGGESNTPPTSTTTQPDNNVSPSEPTEITPDSTEEPSVSVEATNVAFGETISLDFVEMTFEESGVAEDIQQSITTDIAVGTHTRVTGPQPEEGKQFLYLRACLKSFDKNGGVEDNREKTSGSWGKCINTQVISAGKNIS